MRKVSSLLFILVVMGLTVSAKEVPVLSAQEQARVRAQTDTYVRLQAQLIAFGKELTDISTSLRQQSQNPSADDLKKISDQLTSLEQRYNDFNTNQVKPSKRENLIADEHLAPIDNLCHPFEALAEQIHQNLKLLIDRTQAQDALYQAIASDSEEGIKKAITAGADVNREKDGKPLLLTAILLNRNKAIEALLGAGARSNKILVEYALKLDNLKAAYSLVKKGNLDINALYNEKTLLEYAQHDLPMALLILKSGAKLQNSQEFVVQAFDVLGPNNSQKQTGLDLIQEVINHGYDVRTNNYLWDIVLQRGDHEAQCLAILDLLMKNGANPNQIIESPYLRERKNAPLTPLFIAIKFATKRIVQFLLDAGADINQRATPDAYNMTIRTDKSRPSSPLVTPLAYAISLGKSGIVELLTARGASL